MNKKKITINDIMNVAKMMDSHNIEKPKRIIPIIDEEIQCIINYDLKIIDYLVVCNYNTGIDRLYTCNNFLKYNKFIGLSEQEINNFLGEFIGAYDGGDKIMEAVEKHRKIKRRKNIIDDLI